MTLKMMFVVVLMLRFIIKLRFPTSVSAQKVSQHGVLNLSLSDHHMIYCTRKSTKAKSFYHKHIKIRSMKNYNKDLFLKKLKLIKFPKYFDFININVDLLQVYLLVIKTREGKRIKRKKKKRRVGKIDL